ncbi:hypothetical protein H5410_049836, partial [Solanum commersonii]
MRRAVVARCNRAHDHQMSMKSFLLNAVLATLHLFSGSCALEIARKDNTMKNHGSNPIYTCLNSVGSGGIVSIHSSLITSLKFEPQ